MVKSVEHHQGYQLVSLSLWTKNTSVLLPNMEPHRGMPSRLCVNPKSSSIVEPTP